MFQYNGQQNNIHIKYKNVKPRSNRKIKIIKTNQRKK